MANYSVAENFERRLFDLLDDMRDERIQCYEDSDGVVYIEFGDGSVIVEVDTDQILTLDKKEWQDFENAHHITECGITTENEQATAMLKANL